jgi:glycosyltransferase involved in cell wall biosynthesis
MAVRVRPPEEHCVIRTLDGEPLIVAADLSVLTPSYGYERFVADAIETVLRQEGVSVEHVVQAGGSHDEPLVVCIGSTEGYCGARSPIVAQSNVHNNALTKASSRWIAWLNIDEVCLPGVLVTLIRHAERTAADVFTPTASPSTRTAGSSACPAEPLQREDPPRVRLLHPYQRPASILRSPAAPSRTPATRIEELVERYSPIALLTRLLRRQSK